MSNMRELVCCRLPDVDAGASGEMLSRNLFLALQNFSALCRERK